MYVHVLKYCEVKCIYVYINSAELKLIFIAFGQTNICLFCGCS